MGTEALALAIVVGDMHICFKRFRILVINDCNYVLDFKINLISVSYLYKDYYSVAFNIFFVIIGRHNKQISKTILVHNLYFI